MPVNSFGLPSAVSYSQTAPGSVYQGYQGAIASRFMLPMAQQALAQQHLKTALIGPQAEAGIFNQIASPVLGMGQYLKAFPNLENIVKGSIPNGYMMQQMQNYVNSINQSAQPGQPGIPNPSQGAMGQTQMPQGNQYAAGENNNSASPDNFGQEYTQHLKAHLLGQSSHAQAERGQKLSGDLALAGRVGQTIAHVVAPGTGLGGKIAKGANYVAHNVTQPLTQAATGVGSSLASGNVAPTQPTPSYGTPNFGPTNQPLGNSPPALFSRNADMQTIRKAGFTNGQYKDLYNGKVVRVGNKLYKAGDDGMLYVGNAK